MATTVFGEVAAQYDEVRPEYPAEMAAEIREYAGGVPAVITEIGAGTGKATALFAQVGAPMVCVEPDARMAQVLRAKFPAAQVVIADADSWKPPPGGVPVLAGALVWHLLDEKRRCARVHDVLAENGVVALIGRKHVADDRAQQAAFDTAYSADGRAYPHRRPTWIADDLEASGLFTGITTTRHDTMLPLSAEEYLRFVSTWSSFRLRTPQQQAALLEALRAAIARTGGSVLMRLETTLNLARRA
ncbi:MAG: hypothetical protein HOV79_28275 [Hamadaea sp.]|nr:hypothetical protein [Hamadaea sp.]